MPHQQNDNLKRRIKHNDVMFSYQTHVEFAGARVQVIDDIDASVIDIAADGGGGGLTYNTGYAEYHTSTENTSNSTVNFGTLSSSNNTPIDPTDVFKGWIEPLVTGVYSIHVYAYFQGTELTPSNRFSMLVQPRRWPNGSQVQGVVRFPFVLLSKHASNPALDYWGCSFGTTTVLTRDGDVAWDDVVIQIRRANITPDAGKTLDITTTIQRIF
jgi:hypothetical protein